MYIQEMHIDVQQATQKLAANRTRKLFDDEIDWLLNRSMDRFIQSRVTPKKDGSGGYEIDAFNVDAIRPLMATGIERPAYIADPRRYQATLPGDYAYMISDESSIKKPYTGDSVVTSTLTNNYLVIPITTSLKTTGPWYTALTILINGNAAFDVQGYAQQRNVQYAGYNSQDAIFYIVPAILRYLADAGWDVYWERCGTLYMPKSLIINTGPVVMTASISIDGSTAAASSFTKTFQAADLPLRIASDTTNRLTASHIVDNVREVAFYKTQPESPISVLGGNTLYTYANKSFIVSITRLAYVRKPRRMSLILGEDCELAPEFHPLICDLTTEYYDNLIQSPAWETKLKDNMVRTPI